MMLLVMPAHATTIFAQEAIAASAMEFTFPVAARIAIVTGLIISTAPIGGADVKVELGACLGRACGGANGAN